MTAYFIVDVEVTDQDTYDTYRTQVSPILKQYGGRFLVRGGKTETIKGDWRPNRVVVLQFNDTAAAKRFATPRSTDDHRVPASRGAHADDPGRGLRGAPLGAAGLAGPPLTRRSPAAGKPRPAERKSEGGFRDLLRELYTGRSERAHRFRYALLGVDLLIVGFVVVSSFFRGRAWTEALDPVLGTIILLDFVARLWITRRPLRELLHPITIADLIVIVSLLAPALGENFAFLRVLRSYRTVTRLKRDVPFLRQNQEVIFAVAETRPTTQGPSAPCRPLRGGVD